ncbi:uncharacterized protein Adf1_9 [Zeugodacus cucurbitae]|uniref:uncharacterized protein Adf1_9 n=1 Tax=Zeugodacus cucurbitae TaxID=28588 RepID=UPI0023D8EDD0|nr:uncharacterized protein Adf1_9 [Zeugodacus cucurbitae]
MDEFSEQLIYKVQDHPYLYDDQHKEYKNLIAKEQAWKKIGEELKMSPMKAKARWKNLRDSYVKYKNQLSKVKDVTEQEAVNNRYMKWTGRSYLSFLDEILARRSQSSSHVQLKSENASSPHPTKRAKSVQRDDDDDEQSYKKVKMDKVKKKSQNKIRSTLNALTNKRRHEKTQMKEAQSIEESSLIALNAKVENLNIPPDNCLEISTTNGIPTHDGNEAVPKSNETALHYLEDKRNYLPQTINAGRDAIDHLFSSYAQTFRALPLRQQVHIKIEMAKLFATAEIESQQ